MTRTRSLRFRVRASDSGSESPAGRLAAAEPELPETRSLPAACVSTASALPLPVAVVTGCSGYGIARSMPVDLRSALVATGIASASGSGRPGVCILLVVMVVYRLGHGY